jgi:hypothetical protein
MISPIPNRGGNNNLVGSVSRYEDVSQDQTQQAVRTSPTKHSPNKRQRQYDESVIHPDHSVNQTHSPSRDLARTIIHNERVHQQSPKKKEITSPTKRLEQMKNAHVRNAQIAQGKPDSYGKMLYTITPDEAYLVKREYIPQMDAGDMTHVE